MSNPTYEQAIKVAAGLASEDGENSEYDRGMDEVIDTLQMLKKYGV